MQATRNLVGKGRQKAETGVRGTVGPQFYWDFCEKGKAVLASLNNFGGLWAIEVFSSCLGTQHWEDWRQRNIVSWGQRKEAVCIGIEKVLASLMNWPASGGAVSPQPEKFLKMSEYHNTQKIIIYTGIPQRSCTWVQTTTIVNIAIKHHMNCLVFHV